MPPHPVSRVSSRAISLAAGPLSLSLFLSPSLSFSPPSSLPPAIHHFIYPLPPSPSLSRSLTLLSVWMCRRCVNLRHRRTLR